MSPPTSHFLAGISVLVEPVYPRPPSTDRSNIYSESNLKHRYNLHRGFPLYVSKHIQSLCLADSNEYGFSIDRNIEFLESNVGGGINELDLFEFLSRIFDENGERICYGKLKERPEFKKMFDSYTSSVYLWLKSKTFVSTMLRDFILKRAFLGLRDCIAKSIHHEYKINRKPNPDDLGVKNFVDIYIRNPDIQEFGAEGFATILVDAWFYVSKVIPTRLVNIIFDLSIQPNLYFVLIQEQKDLIAKYGNDITHDITKEMIFMDAFIRESLNNSNPASYIFCFACKDMFLSNGTLLKKGELTSINMFSRFNSGNSSANKKFDIYKHILNKKPFTDTKYWFINNNSNSNSNHPGSRNACPFAEYSGTMIKVFVALSIRKLYVFSNIDGNQPEHPGYINLSTVLPTKKSVYFKKHNINEYRDLIDLKKEYSDIINSDKKNTLSE
ncbi:hypothetical protein BB560_002019 [Smittium megazygosporum]|uniref:Cytochrome P450 n=1 Tax=Smittium megazygosporum TaxID=133381 RepID=A0A2T9ZG01_9FUNG|nr:hypothetical protein BB560_002019 [Smittium megazygosporum]